MWACRIFARSSSSHGKKSVRPAINFKYPGSAESVNRGSPQAFNRNKFKRRVDIVEHARGAVNKSRNDDFQLITGPLTDNNSNKNYGAGEHHHGYRNHFYNSDNSRGQTPNHRQRKFRYTTPDNTYLQNRNVLIETSSSTNYGSQNVAQRFVGDKTFKTSKYRYRISNEIDPICHVLQLQVSNCEMLYGVYPVLLALKVMRRKIHKIYCKHDLQLTNDTVGEIFRTAKEYNIECQSLEGTMFKKLFSKDTVHQNIFCVASELPIDVVCSENIDSFLTDTTIPNQKFKSVASAEGATQHSSNANTAEINAASAECATQHSSDANTAEINAESAECATQHSSDANTAVMLEFNSHERKTVENMESEQENSVDTTNLSVPPSSFEETRILSEDIADEADSTRSDSRALESRLLWVMLDRVMDPMNLGAVLRSCAYFGVSRILLTASCGQMSPVVSKASSGAAELVPITRVLDTRETLEELKLRHWHLVAAVSTGATVTDLGYLPCDKNILLIVGNEGSGISPEIGARADASICVSGVGSFASDVGCLNVSVATAILLHSLQVAK